MKNFAVYSALAEMREFKICISLFAAHMIIRVNHLRDAILGNKWRNS